MERLKDKVALVTGSGAGIGLATAELFAAEGAHVYLAEVDADSVVKAAEQIQTSGGSVTPVTTDVSRGQDVTALMRTIAADHGRIDALVNNAGINVRTDFRHMTDADWVKLRDVNLDGVIRIARDAFPLLKASGKASLVNMASIMGNRGMRSLAAYGATKGAISALTRGLAVEYAPYNIRVNALAPGFIETALTERVLRIKAFSDALLEQTPLRRFGTSMDVAQAALFLVSDESSFITGTEIAIDGGMAAAL